MQCNIDAKGKAVRLIYGMLMIVAALVVAALALLGVITGVWPWVVVGVLVLLGAFGIYESRKGWCAVRAMGFKTPY